MFFCFNSCTGLINNLTATNIKGGWNATSIKDDATGKVSSINISTTNFILNNKIGDALFFNDDNTFVLFKQKDGNSGTTSGKYSVDVLTLSLTFNGQSTFKRSLVSISETEMIMRDTIFGIPKTVTYQR